jgi:hypothetical protein
MSPTLTLALLLGAAGLQPAGKMSFEKSFPPGVSQVRVEGDQLVMPTFLPREVTVQRKVQVNEGGKVVEKVVTEKQIRYELVDQKQPLKGVKARYVSGKEIAARELPKLLAKNTVVLLSYGPVSKTWLAVYKPDVILLTMPPPTPPAGLPPPKKE